MREKILSLILFIASILIIVALLKVINWVPFAIQGDMMRRYSSIEAVRTKLNIADIYVPSYFPQRFKWPPSEIFAQGRPFTAIVMEFRDIDKKDTALMISQSAAGAGFSPDSRIKISNIKEKVRYQLKGRDALLEVGTCKDEELCSRISWREGRYELTVAAKSNPFDLIKIADSMIH